MSIQEQERLRGDLYKARCEIKRLRANLRKARRPGEVLFRGWGCDAGGRPCARPNCRANVRKQYHCRRVEVVEAPKRRAGR